MKRLQPSHGLGDAHRFNQFINGLAYQCLSVGWTRSIRLYAGLLSAGAYLAAHLAINATVMFLGVCLVLAAWFVGRKTGKQRKHLRVAVTGSIALLFALAAWIGATSPAHAVFLQGAQDFFTTAFASTEDGDQTTTAIVLVFNVIRAIFLIYIAIAFVRVVQGARQDEDWQTLARTPVIIVVAVAVVDVITTFIVPTGGEDPPPAPGG